MVQMFSRPVRRIGPVAYNTYSAHVGLCFLLCPIGCTAANVKSTAVATPTTSPLAPIAQTKVEVAGQAQWEFTEVTGGRTPLLFWLPKVGRWQVDDTKTTWWVASNRALEMQLEAKLWPARRLVTWQECLADFGRWRGDSVGGILARAIETKDISVPPGFTTRLIVTVSHGEADRSHAGSVLAVGADVARCFAFVGSIHPLAALPEDELLARVALVTEGIVPRIRARSIEQRLRTD